MLTPCPPAANLQSLFRQTIQDWLRENRFRLVDQCCRVVNSTRRNIEHRAICQLGLKRTLETVQATFL